ncbi:MAG: Gfo/Idh/MocA family oxidoreductase [Ekhidna sp.]|nr:Gfo/Idh/MocA family oxidoreductase [Ekhidna sp.]
MKKKPIQMNDMQKLIQRFKNYRKRKYLAGVNKKEYAFVGLGMHSINNLLPVINYLKINLKYFVTKSLKNARLIDKAYPYSIGTNDFDKVLNDKDISGVFISSHPLSHYGLVKKTLEAGKNVFVEKPPCTDIRELKNLIEIEKASKAKCVVGLQKQYAPYIKHLKKEGKDVSYNYRFVTGFYPEGDAYLDLFIHPLSLIAFLFGPVKQCNVLKTETGNAETVFLQLKHENENIGTVELSTDYSWCDAAEKLIINTPKKIYQIIDSEELSYVPKQGHLLNIPREKIWKSINKNLVLQKRNNFNPVLQNNQLYTSGYFTEVATFINICESGLGINNSSLFSCVEAYKLIDQIKNNRV